MAMKIRAKASVSRQLREQQARVVRSASVTPQIKTQPT
jgi:hypothetical protein